MLIYANLIGLLSVAITMIENIWIISIGRTIFGISCGIMIVCVPKMIEETVPHNLIGSFGIITNLSINWGMLIALLMGFGLPEHTSNTYS